MVWQPRVFVNNTLILSCPGGCTFLTVRRKRTGFPAGSSPVGLPLAGPCSVTLLLGPGGVKNNPALDPGRGGYSAWYSNGRHIYGRSCQSRSQAGRETRPEKKRRQEPRRLCQYGTQILTEDTGQGSERAHKRWCSGPEEKHRHESLGDFALAG